MSKEPDYKRPFEQEDFRGYFRWSSALTKKLGGSLYHACHKNELEEILDNEKLHLRSKWKLNLPKHGLWEAPGTWVGLNYFSNGNRYGPFLIEFPLTVLDGCHFMVFRRNNTRNRYFFVQYEARIPIYSFGKAGSKVPWRNVKPTAYFDENKGSLSKKNGAIYDIVITRPIDLDGITIRGTNHPSCIPGKCSGQTEGESNNQLQEIAEKRLRDQLACDDKYMEFCKAFPIICDKKVEMPDPDWHWLL